MNLAILIRTALLSVLLAACIGTDADLQVLNVALSPAAQPVHNAILGCTPGGEDLFISIDILYPGTFELSDYDLYLLLGEPDDSVGFAASLAMEKIVMVLHTGLDIESLDRNQVADLLNGRIENWAEFGGPDEPVTLWIGPESDEPRRIVEEEILRGRPLAAHAQIANSDQISDSVNSVAGSAGLLPAAWAGEPVPFINLGIEVPLFAVSATEPQGAGRELLACLQGSGGQAILAEDYETQ